jgi:hypothetical protein
MTEEPTAAVDAASSDSSNDDHPNTEALRDVVALAVRAPSLHNSQPWRFEVGGGVVDVLADPSRRLPIADPTGWAVRIACGAAVLNLRLGLAMLGHDPEVSLFPDPASPELLARVRAGHRRPATPTERALATAIRRRHSNRYPFVPGAVPAIHLERLRVAAENEGAWLAAASHPALASRVASIVRAAEREVSSRPGYRDELWSWRRTSGSATDGVPDRHAGPQVQPGELLPRRDYGGANAPTHQRFEAEPLLLVLGIHGDGPADDLRAGQALQRVLLTATDVRLAVSMFSQPIEAPALRTQLAEAFGRSGHPHMVLRVGFGRPGSSPPRRPVDDVVDRRPA